MVKSGAAQQAELKELVHAVNPGPKALDYLEHQGLDPDSMTRVLKLMRTIEIDRAQEESKQSTQQ